jgi:hypothetical protein
MEMIDLRALGRVFALCLIGGVCVGAAPGAGLTALSMLEPGLWQLRIPGEPARNICLGDPAALMQLRHSGVACSRLVIENERTSATVHYSCPGAGWGRTTLRITTPRSARIDTQGIAANAPFDVSVDARRTGDCGTKATGLIR